MFSGDYLSRAEGALTGGKTSKCFPGITSSEGREPSQEVKLYSGKRAGNGPGKFELCGLTDDGKELEIDEDSFDLIGTPVPAC